MNEYERERRKMRAMLGTAVAACLVLLAAIIPAPFVVERPGPVVDTLGDVEIEGETVPVISISDAETFPTSGELNLLTVSLVGSPDDPANWLSLLPALLDPSQRIAPTAEFFPEGSTQKDREEANAVLMDSSQMQSAAAAFRALGEPVEVDLRVAGVSEGGPAEGVLQEGDVLRSVDGREASDFTALRELIVSAGEGAPLRIGIERGGETLEVAVTPAIPEGGGEPLLGAMVSSEYELPAEVDISLSRIGGPSAGMVFALAIYDELTPGELLDGLAVSGTGTVTDAGAVGGIGGLTQKMWAASRAGSELFLMPLENCGDIPERIPPGLTIAPVATLEEAIAAVETAAEGREPAGVERCDVG